MSITKNAIVTIAENHKNFDIEKFEKPQLLGWKNGNPVIYLPQYIGTKFETYTVNGDRLLSNGVTNTKTAKNGFQYLTAQHSIRPANFAGIGNVCPNASPGCLKSCLQSTGNANVFKMITAARDAKTAAFYLTRDWYIENVVSNLNRWEKRAAKQQKKLAVRLNVLSDIPWEKLIKLETFSDTIFYDYTKNPRRAGLIAPNYWVTFSRSETNEYDAIKVLKNGNNIAAVFHDSKYPAVGNRSKLMRLPKTYKGYRVIDGDISDARFDDKRGKTRGIVVGLRLKSANWINHNAAVDSGFSIAVK